MTTTGEELYSTSYFEYLVKRNAFRRQMRSFYLKDIVRYCMGKTIDFGCGVGELLSLLETGSMGLEVNPKAVAYCTSKGQDVRLYDPDTDNYKLEMVPAGTFTTFTMNHVLEHIEDAGQTAATLFDSCHRLGIKRIVLTVPGIKGYQSDATHRTFINTTFFEKNHLGENPFYKRVHAKHFPVNSAAFGKYFTHNEWRIIFDTRHG